MSAVQLFKPEIAVAPVAGASHAGRTKPLLEMHAVSKSYGAGANTSSVLSNINLSIAEGEFVAIVGFSGSGKNHADLADDRPDST